MQIEYIKTALKIAELGSITKAANTLFYQHRSATCQLNLLEAELGFKLFNRFRRGPRPMLLTERGAVYLFWASQALAMLEEGKVEALESKPTSYDKYWRPDQYWRNSL